MVRIKAKRAVQTGLAVLLVADYFAAKTHFLARYDPNQTGRYAREHIVYWLIAAALALLIWGVEKSFPSKPTRPPG
jgi:purine-cytosine permease-like protein